MCEPPQRRPLQAREPAAEDRQLLRVTLLTLEGVRLPRAVRCEGAAGGGNDIRAADEERTVAAWAGFRTSFPATSTTVRSSQYRSLFEGEGGMLAVESSKVEAARWDNVSGSNGIVGALHWRAETNAACPDEQRIKGEDGPMPHLEIELPSSPPARQQSNSELPDVIEIHVCVVCCTSRAGNEEQSQQNACGEDNFDENDDEFLEEDHVREERQSCCGVAHLKLEPSHIGASTDGVSDTKCNIPANREYDRPGGETITMSIRRTTPRRTGYLEDGVELAENATLTIRVERTAVPIHHYKDTEQQHYIESEWNGGKSAPASVIYRGSGKDSLCADCEKMGPYDSTGVVGGLGQLFKRAASTLTMMASYPAQTNLEQPRPSRGNEKRDGMVGKIVVADMSPHLSRAETSHRNGHCRNETVGPAQSLVRKETAETHKTSDTKRSLVTFGERFLCGASFGDLGNALKMAAAAGHHCDEDHVGLYVADSDEAGSSIAT